MMSIPSPTVSRRVLTIWMLALKPSCPDIGPCRKNHFCAVKPISATIVARSLTSPMSVTLWPSIDA